MFEEDEPCLEGILNRDLLDKDTVRALFEGDTE